MANNENSVPTGIKRQPPQEARRAEIMAMDPDKRPAHVFERAGFGKAPFRLVAVREETYQSHHSAPVQPAGTCDYCQNGILIVCIIRSSDGHYAGVGSDCIRKHGDAGLRRDSQAASLVRDRAPESGSGCPYRGRIAGLGRSGAPLHAHDGPIEVLPSAGQDLRGLRGLRGQVLGRRGTFALG